MSESITRPYGRRTLAGAAVAGSAVIAAAALFGGKAATAQSPTLLQVVERARDLSRFAAWVKQAGLEGELAAAGNVALFVPHDLAIERLTAAQLQGIEGNRDTLRRAVLAHLTATPKDEIDHNTYSMFDLDTGVPTDAYTLEDAVADRFLVPMKAVSVPLKFVQQGITYAELSEAEKERWDEAEWEEGAAPPDRVEAEAVNQWLFNEDTVDKVLQHLMTHGQKVEAGDRLGKTIIFAKNKAHALFIAQRFDANYPHLRGHFARLIDSSIPYRAERQIVTDWIYSSTPLSAAWRRARRGGGGRAGSPLAYLELCPA